MTAQTGPLNCEAASERLQFAQLRRLRKFERVMQTALMDEIGVAPLRGEQNQVL